MAMDPQAEVPPAPMSREEKRNQQFKPKWRHFHPQDTLYMRNPFNEDIVFQVADEFNQPFLYRLAANKINELPGGPVATLGLKAVIDKMISENGRDKVHIWSPEVRKRYEDQVIERVKTAPTMKPDAPGAPINLAQSGEDEAEDEAAPETEKEQAFPTAKPKPGTGANYDPKKQELKKVANASVGGKDQVIEED